MSEALRAPFPWNGGKSRVAAKCWNAFGADIANYIEPFFGSGAVLLGRPGGAGKIETVNDLDGGICNFFRAIAADPDAVAEWCDWPVSELDLHARHAWLVERLNALSEQLRADPDFCCPKTAGWWVWGICQWIGTGWCGGIKHGEPRPNLNSGQGVHAQGTRELPHQRPHVSGDSAGMGVLSKKLPSLRVDSGASGNGVHRSGLAQKMPMLALNGTGAAESGRGALSESARLSQAQRIPHLFSNQSGSGSKGVHSESLRDNGLPAIGNDRGINGVAAPPCLDWFRALQQRLRRVRIVCGDWTRVLGDSVLGRGKNEGGRRPTAVLLDPPYDPSLRAKRIYNHDADGVAADVRAWALENGDDPDLRIIVCGYYDEHVELLSAGWSDHRWKGARGRARTTTTARERRCSEPALPISGAPARPFSTRRPHDRPTRATVVSMRARLRQGLPGRARRRAVHARVVASARSEGSRWDREAEGGGAARGLRRRRCRPSLEFGDSLPGPKRGADKFTDHDARPDQSVPSPADRQRRPAVPVARVGHAGGSPQRGARLAV